MFSNLLLHPHHILERGADHKADSLFVILIYHIVPVPALPILIRHGADRLPEVTTVDEREESRFILIIVDI